jgi:hypothetical protein
LAQKFPRRFRYSFQTYGREKIPPCTLFSIGKKFIAEFKKEL